MKIYEGGGWMKGKKKIYVIANKFIFLIINIQVISPYIILKIFSIFFVVSYQNFICFIITSY